MKLFKKTIPLSILLLFGLIPLLPAQMDTLSIKMEVGLRGRWQTGNLNQLGLNPNARLSLSNSKYQLDLKANYQYLKVEGFTAISDLWTNGIYKYQPERRIYPIGTFTSGFAKSYKIDHSFVIGAGVGLNIWKSSPLKFFQIHGFAGYLNLQFEGEQSSSSPMIGFIIETALPLWKNLFLNWDLQTYNPLSEKDLWGFNNSIGIFYKLSKSLQLNLNHQIIFNNKTVSGIEKVNTLMMFGIQFSI